MGFPMSFDVIVCGSLHLDIVVKAPALPRIDETAVGHAWQQVCGGKGGNQAVRAAQAGATTAMIGRIGADAFGETLRHNLQNENIDLSCLSTDASLGSGMSVAILQDDGDYGAVIVSGANTTIAPSSLKDSWLQLGGARVLVLQNEVPHAVNVAAAKAAKAGGATVLLNAAPARTLNADLLGHVDVLIVNRVEAEQLADIAVQDRATARLAVPALLRHGCAVVITLGGDGLVVAVPGVDPLDIAAIPVRVTSTHGAGDCFVGTLAAHLARGETLAAACHLANARAAAFVSRA
jgi:ribokinase